MFLYALILAAVVYAAAVAQTIVESARYGGRAIISFGTILFLSDSSAVGVGILTVLSATAALALGGAVGYGRGRWLERRMAAEVDQRWEKVSREDAGLGARQRLLDWRVGELQAQVGRLTAERNALLDELEARRMNGRERLQASDRADEPLLLSEPEERQLTPPA